jgi:UDP-GlcNAc:undecaprenyl-phosphate/decaprenyl-phosphate GlcNAc-1-phosphate transferase
MFSFSLSQWLIAFITLILAIALTYAVRELAHRFGFVAKPKADRWHQRPTAMMGGVAIFLTTVIVYLLFLPHTPQTWVVMGGSAFLFLVGLIDDVLHIKPYQKLFGQVVGTAIVVGSGLVLPWTDFELLNNLITAFWLIGITNAINLLDNMDGLAGGIAAIAAATLALVLAANGQTNEFLLVTTFVAALVGFLRFNFNPASIFMGDCGSMFVGFFLASSVLIADVGGQSRSIFSVLAVPVLTLFVPIFDTTFVTILRKIWGRKASQGGRDHTSHRLVALGLSERTAVLMLYGFAALAGMLAFGGRGLKTTHSLALIGLFTAALTIIGVYLGKVKVYEEQHEELALRNNAVFGFLLDISHKRRIFEIFLDVLLITLSYYAAYVLLFGDVEGENWNLFLKSLPILIVLKLFALLSAGVYRGLWRYTSVDDLVTFAKGVALGTVFSVLAILVLYRFEHFSRTVFFIDGVILLMAVAASRMAFRLFRQVLPTANTKTGRRILIYGAGDGGELALREIYNNPELGYKPVGFVDDDPLKKGRKIHGLRVLGGNGSIPQICRQYQISEVLLTSRKIKPERLRELRRECENVHVEVKRAAFKVEPLDEFFG